MHIFPPIDWTRHPLHAAAMSGNRDEVDRLIAAGADLNENLDLVGTPLHVAICTCVSDTFSVFRGHVDVVELLLTKRAAVHPRRTYHGTPLHDAARKGLLNIAAVLLSHGAIVNSKEDDQRRTPLHCAVSTGKLEMVRYLLSQGADIDAIADFRPHVFAARIFEDIGFTPVHLAAREGLFEIAQTLIDAGASVRARRFLNGETPVDL